MNNYYVYFHKNPITKEIFYVGIGNKKRAWNFKNRNIHWLRYVGKYGKPIIEIIRLSRFVTFLSWPVSETLTIIG